MRILAIDPGKTIGWAVIEEGIPIDCGIWQPWDTHGAPNPNLTPSQSLLQFQHFVNEFFEDALAWEYQFTSSRAKDLWEGQAQIKELIAFATTQGIPTCALTPGEWKSLIAGNGRATYAQVKKALRLRAQEDGWELPKKITDHEVAAIGISLAAWAKHFQFVTKGAPTGGD